MTAPGFVEPPASPEVDQILQYEPVDQIVVPVEIKGTVQTDELPCQKGAAFTYAATSTMSRILNGPDLKRKRVVLTTDGSIKISFTGAQGSGMPVIGSSSATAQLVITYVGEIWVQATTGSPNVGVLVEYWAL